MDSLEQRERLVEGRVVCATQSLSDIGAHLRLVTTSTVVIAKNKLRGTLREVIVGVRCSQSARATSEMSVQRFAGDQS